MKKRKLRHSLNYEGSKGEVNTQPSETVPDQSLTVKEIYQRFASGRPLSKSRNLHFTGDDFFPESRSLDLVDMHDEYLNASQARADAENKLQEQAAKRKRGKGGKEGQAAGADDHTPPLPPNDGGKAQ